MVRKSKEISPTTNNYGDREIRRKKAIEATRVGAFGYIVKTETIRAIVDVLNAVERKRQTLINSQQAREIEELPGGCRAGVVRGSYRRSAVDAEHYEIIENV